MNTISFNTNNQGKISLVQRQHDGKTLIIIERPDDAHILMSDTEAFICPSDFVMLINYYLECKRKNKPIF